MFKLLKRVFSGPSTTTTQNEIATASSDDSRGGAHLAQARGNTLLAAGQFDAAADCYRQAIEAAPATIAGYINLGYALMQLQQTNVAAEVLKQAVDLDPRNPDALYMLATLARDQGDADSAIDYCEQALAANPEFQMAYGELGQLLLQCNRIGRAQAVLQDGIKYFPAIADFHFFLSKVYVAAGKTDDAIDALKHAVTLRPDAAEIHDILAQLLLKRNRPTEALASYRRITDMQPDAIDAWVSQAKLLFGMSRYEDALRDFDRVLSLAPDHIDALMGRGAILLGFKRSAEAIVTCEHVARLRSDSAEAHLNLGAALQTVQRYQDALVSCDRALAINPDSADALINRGTALSGLNRHDEALACHQRALAIRPDDADGRYNECLIHLRLGNFKSGWALHESRWGTAHFIPSKRNFPQPLWLGKETLAGKTILLHAEQGLGDTIQFCRYAKQVADLGAIVLLLVPKSLSSLLTGLAGVSRLIAEGQPLPPIDFQCPLMSLPLALNTTLQTIPADIPYLFASVDLVKRIDAELGNDGALRIGVCWKGGDAYPANAERSPGIAPFRRLISQFDRSVVKFYSLLPNSRETFIEMGGEDLGYELDQRTPPFAETAALIMNLDLIVTCDTSIPHLACALGKPVWILLPLNPDWRWLLERDDCPWYPSARLFRQAQTNEWDSVIDAVTPEINRLANRKSERHGITDPALTRLAD